jgi:putative phosphoesterase
MENLFSLNSHLHSGLRSMLIGLMSDSHDNLPMVDKAVEFFNKNNVESVLHAGDFVAGFVVPHLARLNCNLIGVFGNNDGDHELLQKRFSETKNCQIHDDFASVSIEGFRIALLHGNTALIDSLVASGYFDAVVHGHSHVAGIEQHGKTLSINPGELCGYLSGKPTVAILDTATRQAKIIQI